MADVTDIAETHKSPIAASQKRAVSEALPIEQRTDVTVDELEKTSLPYPAELYNGKVVYKMANPEHGIIQGIIITKFNLYLEQNPIGFAMTETNFRLWPDRPRESRIPDIAFVKKERMPDDLHKFPSIAPDLAVEIISPEDNFLAVMNKADEYLEQGTQIVWLIIPDAREVLVCTKQSKQSVRNVLTAPELLPGFELPISQIFEGVPAPEQV
ncbi:MAG: Uma2 family endonuclease [bacterium]